MNFITKASDNENEFRIDISDGSVKIQGSDISKVQSGRLHIFDQIIIGGDKILFPGQSGAGRVYINNNAGSDQYYKMTFSKESVNEIPLEFQFLKGGVFYHGMENPWEELAPYYTVEGTVAAKADELLVIEWRWPEKDDEADTALGLLAAEKDIWYSIGFEMQIESDETGTENSLPFEGQEEGNEEYQPGETIRSDAGTANSSSKVNTGDEVFFYGFILAMLLSLLLFTAVLHYKRIRKNKNSGR